MEIDIERHKERGTDTHKDTETVRQRETYRETYRETDKDRQTETDRQTDRDRQMGGDFQHYICSCCYNTHYKNGQYMVACLLYITRHTG